MKNICEWSNCKEDGKFKAPIERDNIRNFKLLCKTHIKLFNKSWNYFYGMSQYEIESFIKSDLTWHRPTQTFGSSDNFFNILWNNALCDTSDSHVPECDRLSVDSSSLNLAFKNLLMRWFPNLSFARDQVYHSTVLFPVKLVFTTSLPESFSERKILVF